MYKYEDQKEKLFTDEGQRMFLSIRDNAGSLMKKAGAVRLQEATRVVTGDGWLMLACIDRMIELEEIIEVTNSTDVAGQHRVFIANWR